MTFDSPFTPVSSLRQPGTGPLRRLLVLRSLVLALVQSISEDLRLEEVITRVLESAIESAGADRGLLLLDRDGVLSIVAEGKVGASQSFIDAPGEEVTL